MKASSFLITLSLMLPSLQALSDCPRVLGQQDDRRANAGCLIIRDQQVLLITHRWGGKLGVPGGTLERGELAQCTAYRETLEETGLQVVVGERVQVMKNGFHLYRCIPAESLPEGEPLLLPAQARLEVSDIGWYSLDELRQKDWRFAYQFDLFMAVARKAMQSSSDSAAGDATGGLQEK
ncbi:MULTISPECIES: NUDIX hydrolase [Alcanivorax]|jgi:8-oxo-dGTP diphosphatase|uniref:NUDIX hydrolase n=1 Tax=Alcanivorax TaxID=59753 RepID=UPI000789C9C6|nr:NUDIX hydrolase [Alcanivorax sp. NBRC 102028]